MRTDFFIMLNVLGLPRVFQVTITDVSCVDLVQEAIRVGQTGGNSYGKIGAIKHLRSIWPDYLSLKEAKDMIDKAWST